MGDFLDSKPLRVVTGAIDKLIERADGTLRYIQDEMPLFDDIYGIVAVVMCLGIVCLAWPFVAVHRVVTRKKRRARAVVEAMASLRA